MFIVFYYFKSIKKNNIYIPNASYTVRKSPSSTPLVFQTLAFPETCFGLSDKDILQGFSGVNLRVDVDIAAMAYFVTRHEKHVSLLTTYWKQNVINH